MRRPIVVALAAAACVCVVAVSGWGQTPNTASVERGLFRSNALGMELEAIPVESLRGDEIPDAGYVLVVERARQRVERMLYEDGELRERTVRELDEAGTLTVERVFEEETLRREIAFSANGRRRYLREYGSDGELRRETRYSYQGDRVVLRRILGPAGDERYTEELSYYAGGGLRRLHRSWSDGRTRTVRYSMVGGDIIQERFESESEGRLVRYDSAQRPIYEREWRGDMVTRETTHRYEGSGNTPSRTEERLPRSARSFVRRFDDEGRLIYEALYEEERLVRETRQDYGASGLVERVTRERGRVERRTFRYEEGRLVEERVFENETLTRSIAYTDQRSRVERRYRDGELFARIYYEDDTAVREEILRNGELVDSRELR